MKEQMHRELNEIASILKKSKNLWRWKTALLICEIPEGCLVNYGAIAKCVNNKFGLNINARNVAWLREYLYNNLRNEHKTAIPLHRIAKKGDYKSKHDSVQTCEINEKKRKKEGTYNNESWCFCNIDTNNFIHKYAI